MRSVVWPVSLPALWPAFQSEAGEASQAIEFFSKWVRPHNQILCASELMVHSALFPHRDTIDGDPDSSGDAEPLASRANSRLAVRR
jgi:hypothetical protein